MSLTDAVFRRLFKFRFRYDIFISYARHDGRDYAVKLRDQLRSLDFSCFLDYDELPAGNSLNRTLTRAIARSATAVVVGTEGAVRSRYVGLEVSEFARTGRPLVPIDFEGSLGQAPWAVIKERDLVWIDESSAALGKGVPSPQVADSIDKLFTYTRRNVRVRGQIAATAVLFVLGAIGSAVLIERQVRVARAAQHDAQVQQDNAKEQERLAHEATTRATAEQARAVSERQRADVARAAADAAETRAKEETRRAEEQALATRTGFSNLLSVESKTLVETQPSLSTLLAVEAQRAMRPGDPRVVAAEETLRDTITRVGGRLIASGGQSMSGIEYLTRTINQKVDGLAVSADRHWAADVVPDGVRLFDLQAKNAPSGMRLLEQAQGPVSFTIDGTHLITGAADPRRPGAAATDRKVYGLWLWDLSAPHASPITLGGRSSPIHATSTSPDSRWLLAISENDATAALWDLKATPTPTAPTPITLQVGEGRQGLVTMGFSPDSRWLATSAGDWMSGNFVQANRVGQLRLWDLTSATPAATAFTLPGHTQVVTQLVFSPDGHRLATASYECDTGVRVWDLTSRDPAAAPAVMPHEGSIGAMAFTTDSRWLATGSGLSQNCPTDGTLRVWRLAGGDAKGAAAAAAKPIVLAGHEGPIFNVGFTPDNSILIATAGSGNSTAEGYLVADVRGMRSLFNHQGSATAHFWYLAGRLGEGEDDDDLPETPQILLRDPSGAADAFAMTPDRRLLIARSRSRLLVWDLVSNPEGLAMGLPPTVLRGHDAQVTAVAFTPDGRWLVTRGFDQSVRLWDLTVGSNATTPRLARTDAAGSALMRDAPIVMSADRRLVAAVGRTEAYVWTLDGQEPSAPRTLRGHSEVIRGLTVSADRRWLATASDDMTARLWDLATTDPSAHPRVFTHPKKVTEVVLGPATRWLATSTDDGMVRLWDLKGPKASDSPVPPIALAGGAHAIFSADAHWLVTCGNYLTNTPARLWDLTAADPAARPIDFVKTDPKDCKISPDSRWVYIERTLGGSSRDKGESYLWDLKRGATRPPIILHGQPDTFVGSSVFSPDGRWLYTSGYDKVVQRWDLAAPDPSATVVIFTTPPSSGPTQKVRTGALTMSPDGRWLTSVGSEQGQYFLWDLHAAGAGEASRVARILQNTRGMGLSDVAFTPDSRWLVTSHDSLDAMNARVPNGGNVLWRLDADELVPVHIPGREIISNAAFSADARWLVTRGLDTLELWPMRLDELMDLACRTVGRDLTKSEWSTYFTSQAYRPTCPAAAVAPR